MDGGKVANCTGNLFVTAFLRGEVAVSDWNHIGGGRCNGPTPDLPLANCYL